MPYPPDPIDIRTPGKPPVVSRADEREGLRLAQDILGGVGDDRDGWYGAAEARALAEVVVRYREALEHFVNLYPQYKAYFEKIDD